MVLLVGTISAQEEIPTVGSLEEGFNLISWLKHTLNIQSFTIVGQDRYCDVYPKKTIYFDQWDLMDVKAPDGGCSYALINLFDQTWNTIGEYKDELNFYCGDTSGCIAEIYCCPHPECTSDSQCTSWEGTGSECTTRYAVDPYMPLKDENNNVVASYNYCTPQCTGSDINCWREEGGVCVLRTYNCGYETYPNCPTTYPYTSEPACKADLPVGECTSGQTKCIVTTYYTCSNENWVSQGQVPGECGYVAGNGVPTNGASDLRVIKQDFDKGSLLNVYKDAKFTLTLQNFGTETGTINVEAGFYSNSYAKDVAQLFSTVGLFSIVKDQPNCNPAEKFVNTKTVTLDPGESEKIEIIVNPQNALVTFSKTGEYDLKENPLVAFWGLYEECLGGYINEAGTTGRGVMFDYFDFTYRCHVDIIQFYTFAKDEIFCDNQKIGECRDDKLTLDKVCTLTSTIDVVEKNLTAEETIAEDKEELTGCIEAEGLFNTGGEFYTKDLTWYLGWEATSGDIVNPGQLDEHFPGFSSRYRGNKETVCCNDLKPSLIGEKIREYESGWLFFTGDEGTLSYLQYKCVPEGEADFCLEFAHLWINPITKSDDCQQNTIILGVLVILMFIMIARLAGCYGRFEYNYEI